MSYRVLPDGSIETSSLEEALDLSALLAAKNNRSQKPEKFEVQSLPARNDLKSFVEKAKPSHRAILSVLQRDGTITIKSIRELLALDTNNRAAGVVLGLYRALKHAGLRPERILVRDEKGPRRGDDCRYIALSQLKEAPKISP